MALTLAPRGVAAYSPWCKPWELEPNKTKAPDGAAANEVRNDVIFAVTPFGVNGFTVTTTDGFHRRLHAITTIVAENFLRKCH